MDIDVAIQRVAPDAVYDTKGAGANRSITNWKSKTHPKKPTKTKLTKAYGDAIKEGANADWRLFFDAVASTDECRAMSANPHSDAFRSFATLANSAEVEANRHVDLCVNTFVTALRQARAADIDLSGSFLSQVDGLIETARLPVSLRAEIKEALEAPIGPITQPQIGSESGDTFPAHPTDGKHFYDTKLGVPFWYNAELALWLAAANPFHFGNTRYLKSNMYPEGHGDVPMSAQAMRLGYPVIIRSVNIQWKNQSSGEWQIMAGGITATKLPFSDTQSIDVPNVNTLVPANTPIAFRVAKSSRSIRYIVGVMEYSRVGK